MQVNPKKRLLVTNRTKYFDPAKDPVSVSFASPHSYQSRTNKIEGYEARLYWQYKYCEDVGGQTYFYTLTYNDIALPSKYGINCFDYEDLRDFFTGGFRKQLLRKYGTTFKYFVGAELGDGKGERGLHNNPHYHILFFLEPAKNPKFPYVVISPESFRTLVRTYWQGVDQDLFYQSTGIRPDYRAFRYGIAKEGKEDLGKVNSYRACLYVAKYVCKDVKLVNHECDIVNKESMRIRNEYFHSQPSYLDFLHSYLYDKYNIPLDPHCSSWVYNDVQLLQRITDRPHIESSVVPFVVAQIIHHDHLDKDYCEMVDKYVESHVHDLISEWRNRYCNKCRISQGVGDYALKFIKDKMDPLIEVPCKDGIKSRSIGQYYYRKLFTDTHVDKHGSVIRTLNQDGIAYKLHKLPDMILKKSEKAASDFSHLSRKLYDSMVSSDVNTDVTYDYDTFLERLKILMPDEKTRKDVFNRYSEYKLVYEGRFFSLVSSPDCSVCSVPNISVVSDYARFLVPSFYSVSRSDLRLELFLENPPEGCLPYSSHPYFSQYLGIFAVLDLISDFLFITRDNVAQKDAEERAKNRRFFVKREMKDFYSTFKL